MTIVCLSKHAARRAKQRGVTHDLIDLIVDHADIEESAGSGCSILRISRNRLTKLRTQLGDTTDRLTNLVLIWSDRSAMVVTILRDHGRSSGRRYRRAA